MVKKIEYTKGQMFGKLKFIEEVEPLKTASSDIRKAMWECFCGSVFIAQISGVKGGNTKSCSCYRKGGTYNIKHGDAAKDNTHYLYNLWTGIKKRCYNKKMREFKYWGGRGIKMSPNWKNNYPLFKEELLKQIGEKPSEKHSLDRIDNEGNYEVLNVRWATKTEQNYNRRPYGRQ